MFDNLRLDQTGLIVDLFAHGHILDNILELDLTGRSATMTPVYGSHSNRISPLLDLSAIVTSKLGAVGHV